MATTTAQNTHNIQARKLRKLRLTNDPLWVRPFQNVQHALRHGADKGIDCMPVVVEYPNGHAVVALKVEGGYFIA